MKKLPGCLVGAFIAVAFVSACAGVQSRWEAARSANTVEAYDDFLEACPEGDLADQARIRRDELCEERDWKEAESGNTAEAYDRFLSRYPRGKHIDEARARLEGLSRPQAEDVPSDDAEPLPGWYRPGVFMDELLRKTGNLPLRQALTGRGVLEYEGSADLHPSGMRAGEALPTSEKASDGKASLDEEEADVADPLPPAPNWAGTHGAKAVGSAPVRERTDVPIAGRAASAWGRIMYPDRKMNIRSARSMASRLKGQLQAGQPVKVDFLENGWYAVFPVNQKRRSEKSALGYVYAPFMIERGTSDAPLTAAPGEKPAEGAPPKAAEKEDPRVDVRDVTFKAEGDEKELLLVTFDRFYTPAISKIEGETPRIILKIKNVSSFRKEWAAIRTGGRLIRGIRSSMDPKTREAVIVLDMAPEMNYFVNPMFYQKENIYSLEVSRTE